MLTKHVLQNTDVFAGGGRSQSTFRVLQTPQGMGQHAVSLAFVAIKPIFNQILLGETGMIGVGNIVLTVLRPNDDIAYEAVGAELDGAQTTVPVS